MSITKRILNEGRTFCIEDLDARIGDDVSKFPPGHFDKPENARRKKTRPSWDEYFMDMAHKAATRSTCLRRKVGAIAVRDKRILATGYNGAPKGIDSCLETGICLRDQLKVPSGERHELCWASHAEMNGVCQAASDTISLVGTTWYITNAPCSLCLKLLINIGAAEVVYQNYYPDNLTDQLMAQCIEKGIMTFRILK